MSMIFICQFIIILFSIIFKLNRLVTLLLIFLVLIIYKLYEKFKWKYERKYLVKDIEIKTNSKTILIAFVINISIILSLIMKFQAINMGIKYIDEIVILQFLLLLQISIFKNEYENIDYSHIYLISFIYSIVFSVYLFPISFVILSLIQFLYVKIKNIKLTFNLILIESVLLIFFQFFVGEYVFHSVLSLFFIFILIPFLVIALSRCSFKKEENLIIEKSQLSQINLIKIFIPLFIYIIMISNVILFILKDLNRIYIYILYIMLYVFIPLITILNFKKLYREIFANRKYTYVIIGLIIFFIFYLYLHLNVLPVCSFPRYNCVVNTPIDRALELQLFSK